MTPESLKEGSRILSDITSVRESIDRWEKAIQFDANASAKFSASGYSYVPTKHIPFSIIKALALDGHRKDLADLENKFKNL